jgi:GTP-binding protein
LKLPTVTFFGSAALPAQFPRDGLPEVAFLGRSNVGKSSLLNALARTKGLAKVSRAPGRTRLVNFFRVASPGSDLYFVDLPGYGYAKVSAEERQGFERLVTSYLLERAPLALCLFLVDIRHEPMPADEVLEAFLAEHDLPFAVALMKADKLKRGEVVRALRSLEKGLARRARAVVPVSAVTRDGIDDLWSLIRAAVNRGGHEVFQNGH